MKGQHHLPYQFGLHPLVVLLAYLAIIYVLYVLIISTLVFLGV